ncbi:hypothetical protein, partial [Methanocaldococcus infernus]
MKIGIATKPKDINLNSEIIKYYDFHVIDSETEDFINLENLKKVIVTVQSKRDNAYELLELYSSYDPLAICIVLGNRKYLKEHERKKRREVILKVIERALDLFNNIWVGTEKVEDLVKPVIEEHDLTAFYLYGDSCSLKNRAIYVPYSFQLKNKEFINNYLEKRKSKDID